MGAARPIALARRLGRSVGVELTRYTPANFMHLRRSELLRSGRIDVLVDGGAELGRYATHRREQGFAGRIVSFEPRAEAFAVLSKRAAADGNWIAHRQALSERAGDATITSTGASSSLHGATAAHERIETATLDSFAPDFGEAAIYLKLDVQGHERQALSGAEEMLGSCAAVECELSFRPGPGESTPEDVLALLGARGFALSGFEPSGHLPDGSLAQANALFLPL